MAKLCSTYAERTSDRELGMGSASRDGCLDALVGVRRRHPYVDDREVRAVLGDGHEERLRVGGRGNDVEALTAQHQAQPFAQQGVVLGDHDPHGSSTLSSVGPSERTAHDGRVRRAPPPAG